MSTTLPAYSSMIEGRVRRSCGSVERHTAQSHPKVGTPIDVPLPSTVKVAFIFSVLTSGRSGRGSRLRRTRDGVRYLHIGHAQFVQTILQEILFDRRQVAFGLLRNQTQGIDGLARANDIDTRLFVLLPHQSEL